MTNERRKFFFDSNNFDGPTQKTVEDNLPPPPPVFSVEEMDQARSVSFEEGRAQGIEESRVSREQYIASQLSVLAGQIRSLLLAEDMRKKRFEEDSLMLCHSVFTKAFPSLSARHSIDEILNIIRKVLSVQEQDKIVIDVPAADVAEITDHLSLMMEQEKGRFLICAADDLEPGSCRMKWEYGGAVRNQSALVAQIMEEIEELLAPRLQNSHNTESQGYSDDSPDEAATAGEPKE